VLTIRAHRGEKSSSPGLQKCAFRSIRDLIAQNGFDMNDPVEQIRQKLVDRIAQIIDHHHPTGGDVGSDVACSCGAQGLSGHSGHVADQIVGQLGLKPEIDEVKKRIRYASAMFDWELTQIEGAQC
jgi:hypothetical protein